MTAALLAILADLLLISVLVALYYRRHQRRDLVLSYVAVNVGVLTVTIGLASAPTATGLGLGLFGILSIIRLRSDAITHEEIAYYFTALALGLMAGLHPGPLWFAPAISALLVAVIAIADLPGLLRGSRRSMVTLDRAIPHEGELRAYLESVLGVRVTHLVVQEIDLVRDLTVVDVRSRIDEASTRLPAYAPERLTQPRDTPASVPTMRSSAPNGLQVTR